MTKLSALAHENQQTTLSVFQSLHHFEADTETSKVTKVGHIKLFFIVSICVVGALKKYLSNLRVSIRFLVVYTNFSRCDSMSKKSEFNEKISYKINLETNRVFPGLFCFVLMNFRQNGEVDPKSKPNMASTLYPIRPNVIISFEAPSFYVFWRIKENCT